MGVHLLFLQVWSTQTCGVCALKRNSYFKHLARVVRNFKNIAKTLAHRHQNYMCYQLMNDTYLQHDAKFTGGKCKAFQSKIKNNSTCCRKTIVFGGDRTLPTASANGARLYNQAIIQR